MRSYEGFNPFRISHGYRSLYQWLGSARPDDQPSTNTADTAEHLPDEHSVRLRSRRRGPTPTPLKKKLAIVKEYFERQEGKMNQQSFCDKRYIGTSTLRAWLEELEGKEFIDRETQELLVDPGEITEE